MVEMTGIELPKFAIHDQDGGMRVLRLLIALLSFRCLAVPFLLKPLMVCIRGIVQPLPNSFSSHSLDIGCFLQCLILPAFHLVFESLGCLLGVFVANIVGIIRGNQPTCHFIVWYLQFSCSLSYRPVFNSVSTARNICYFTFFLWMIFGNVIRKIGRY